MSAEMSRLDYRLRIGVLPNGGDQRVCSFITEREVM
jgi:hypothetical protein